MDLSRFHLDAKRHVTKLEILQKKYSKCKICIVLLTGNCTSGNNTIREPTVLQ